ncbi:MAG: hypothetical protein Q9174_001204 [Haloplaca sp. 1 TL-2023]
MHSLRKKYSVDDSIHSWALFDRTFPSTSNSSPTMPRRVFDVGLDVDRIKKGMKLHADSKRTRNNRSNSTSNARPTSSLGSKEPAVNPELRRKTSSPPLRPEHPENTRSSSPSPQPATLPSLSSPTPGDSPPSSPPETPTMPSRHHSFDNQGKLPNTSAANPTGALPTPPDSSHDHDYDLKPPPPNHPPSNSLDTHTARLFSEAHLQTILSDSAFSVRFTTFLKRYQPHIIPVLNQYLEIQKAIKAIDFANAVAAESLKTSSESAKDEKPYIAATLDSVFDSRLQEIVGTLVQEALPAYVTHSFTKTVTETMVREITGTTIPAARDLVGGLAEVFCLSDPSLPDNPIVYASEEFYATTQYHRDFVIGRNCRFLQGSDTSSHAIGRIRQAVKDGKESYETVLNYKRDGTPFVNLVMVAPLYDDRGVVRYYIGAQVDISGLVEEGRGLESLERSLKESRNRDLEMSPKDRKDRALDGLRDLLTGNEKGMAHGVGQNDDRRANEYASRNRGRRDQKQRRRVIGNEDDDGESERERTNWVSKSLGPSGKLPGVYQNYLLLRPSPSLKITFLSAALRIPGLLQSAFLSHIGGSPRIRQGLLSAFENGEGISAKVTWLPKHQENGENGGKGSDEGGKTRYISCTPLLGSDDKVGVWMVVMVENESITGSLSSRNSRAERYKEVPPTPSEYEREDTYPAGKEQEGRTDMNRTTAVNGDRYSGDTYKSANQTYVPDNGRSQQREDLNRTLSSHTNTTTSKGPDPTYAEFLRNTQSPPPPSSRFSYPSSPPLPAHSPPPPTQMQERPPPRRGGGSKRFHRDLSVRKQETPSSWARGVEEEAGGGMLDGIGGAGRR